MRHAFGPMEKSITTSFVWIAIGVLAGWAATHMMKTAGRIVMLENMAVAVFGAFVGGEFISSQLRGSASTETGITAAALGLAVLMAVVVLLLLRTMRGAVGPLRSGKPKRRR